MRRPFFALLLAVGLLLGGQSRAAAQTLLHFVSEPGEPIGQGQERTLDAAAGWRFEVTGNPRYVFFKISIGDASAYENYAVGFALPLRSSLAPGDYPNATYYRGFDQTGGPGLTFSANARDSFDVAGRFQIFEATFDANYQVVSFAANFVLHGDKRKTAVYGELRYNSAVPYTTPAGVADLSADNARVLSIGGTQATLIVRRHGGTSGTLTVDYTTADGTDRAGRDYTPAAGTLTWADGDAADKTITVPVFYAGDPLQGDGTFLLTLSGPGTGTQRQATVMIRNDDSAVTFVHFQSDPGDPVGKGEEQTLNLDSGWFLTPGHGYYHDLLSFDGTSTSGKLYPEARQFRLELDPGPGSNPAVGDYQNAVSTLYNYDQPGLSFGGLTDGATDKLTGNFQVLEAEYDADGNLLRFAANFEQHYQGVIAGLYGQIRYHSTVPLPPSRGTRVGVAATVRDTYDYLGNTPAVFTVTRTGSTNLPLVVKYETSGTAAGGRDYVALKGQKKIPAGKSSAKIMVRAINTGQTGYSRRLSLRLKLVPLDGSYAVVDTAKPARVTITHWPR